jgi:hypothetical protein
LSLSILAGLPFPPYCYHSMLSLHLSHPFFSYIIHSYSSNGKRWDLQHANFLASLAEGFG